MRNSLYFDMSKKFLPALAGTLKCASDLNGVDRSVNRARVLYFVYISRNSRAARIAGAQPATFARVSSLKPVYKTTPSLRFRPGEPSPIRRVMLSLINVPGHEVVQESFVGGKSPISVV